MVYVVTGNAYPTAVFKTRKDAETFVSIKRKAAKKTDPDVVWDVKEFKLR